MFTPHHPTTGRRDFLGRIAVSTALIAGGACGGSAVAIARAAPRPAGTGAWDDSWVGRLSAAHKAVFDCADVEDGASLSHIVRYLGGMRDALGVGDGGAQAVLVVRHEAIVMALDDTMWVKYSLGAKRNPYAAAPAGASPSEPAASLSWIVSHGHLVLGCDFALRTMAGTLATQADADRLVVYADLRAHLIPGVILQPNGIYAVHRAQEAGCTYFKSA